MRFALSNGVSYYRLVLPLELMANRFDGGGTWHALLTIGKPRLDREQGTDPRGVSPPRAGLRAASRVAATTGPVIGPQAQRASMLAAERLGGFNALAANVPAAAAGTSAQALRSLPFSLVVHSYSNVSLQASVAQSSFEPGARVELVASVAQSGIPLTSQVQVWAEVRGPQGFTGTIPLTLRSDERFHASWQTSAAGVYAFRIRARGTTRGGESFTREKTLTAAVWRGGDRPADSGNPGQVIVDYLRDRDARLCEALSCILQRGGTIDAELEKRLREAGLDLQALRKCLGEFCKDSRGCRDCRER
jgi:hypothetical protein